MRELRRKNRTRVSDPVISSCSETRVVSLDRLKSCSEELRSLDRVQKNAHKGSMDFGGCFDDYL